MAHDYYQNPMEHRPRKDDFDRTFGGLKRGVQAWIPDLAAIPGDIADAVAYAGRKVAQGQRQQSVPSLGWGEGTRRAVKQRMSVLPKGDAELGMRAPEETTGAEHFARFANPLMFLNPEMQLKGMAGALAMAHGVDPALMGGLAGVIKSKGGNWLAGSVEDALKGLKRATANTPQEALHPMLRGVDVPQELTNRNSLLNSWIEGPLTKYVKRDMATPDDPVRKLAEQGVLHVAPDSLIHGQRQVHLSGEQLQKLSNSSEALRWENASDNALGNETAGLYKTTRGQDGTTTLSRNPWLESLPNDAKVYDMSALFQPRDLGFPHLIDELSNALNPASGLPRHLQLTPEAVEKMGMEKAVRRVAEINAWRSAQKAEANQALAGKANLVRDYPHSDAAPNPKGLRWVELKKGEVPTSGDIAALDDADRAAKQALQDALKYEGDTMGHCVGGYCGDVLSGRTQIYSLRDAKGEPHVTVEVVPGQGFAGKKTREEYEAFLRGHETPHSEEEIAQALQDLDKGGAWSPSIRQIKGKQNRKPNDEYLPFVQDFVKNPHTGQPWSDVGDLQNTGLRRTRDVFNENELAKIKEAGREISDYHTPEEIQTIGNAVWPGQYGPVNYAQGGPVEADEPPLSALFQAIIDAHFPEATP